MSTSGVHPLKQFRKDNKLSQAQLGERLGVDAMTVYRWEKRDTLPRRGLWPRLTEATDIPISKILEAAKEPSQ